MIECNNKSNCHDLKTISDSDALRVICKICYNTYILRKDWRGVPEKKLYAKIFKQDILQGKDNLFYKYHPEHLRV